MAQVKGLIFDFNGTLFFDSPLHIAAFKRCFEARGMAVPSDEVMVRDIFGMPNASIYKKFFNAHASEEETKAFIEEKEGLYMEFFLSDLKSRRLCDGAYELLDYLKEHSIPYAIATGSEYKTVLFYIKHLGLDRWFTLDNIVYTDGTFSGKPAPDIYRIAASRLGLTPAECAVFEDGTSGIRSARAAEVAKVFALYDERFTPELPAPLTVDKVLHSLSDWRDLLEKIKLYR